MSPNKSTSQKTHKLTQISHEIRKTLYQRFSLQEAAQFLHTDTQSIEILIQTKAISYTSHNGETQIFGFQLLKSLFDGISDGKIPLHTPDRIIDIKKVLDITNFSRATLWRLESTGQFPKRVNLNIGRVGWRQSDIYQWLQTK